MSKFNCTITAERVREVLNYDPSTGVLTRRVRTAKCVKVGDVAGWKDAQGYLTIQVAGVLYKAHRLAWLHYHGAWPVNFIDHIDRCRTNNRILNLQDVTSKQNNENQGPRAGSTSSLKGVCWIRAKGRWVARIKHNGKSFFLGYFTDEQEAGAAYEAAAKLYFTNYKPENLQHV